MLSVWRSRNMFFLVYPHRWNSDFMSQLLCYVSLSLVNAILCYTCIRSGAVTIASHPLFWCILLFCLLTLPLLLYLVPPRWHFSFITELPPPASAWPTYCIWYKHFCTFSFLAFTSKTLPRNICVNLTPKPLLMHHKYSAAVLDCCLQRWVCTALACFVLLFLSPFLASCLWICFFLLLLWLWVSWDLFSKFVQHK